MSRDGYMLKGNNTNVFYMFRDGYMLKGNNTIVFYMFRDGYMLKGNNTTQCFFGNWTGMTPWCKEGNYLYVREIHSPKR